MAKKNQILIAYAVATLTAFCYVVIRAIHMDVTYDEAWTIRSFVPVDVINIIRYEPCDANNHMLNTLLIKLFFITGDHSLFVARIPNILAFILYCYFGYRIVSQYLSPLIGICCYLLLLFNPFVLDFFSLARGYGLSLGFLIASLYYLIAYIIAYKPVYAIWAITCGMFAVLSNFSVLNYWLVFCLMITIFSFFNKQLNFKKTFLYTVSGSVILALLIYEPIRKLKANGNLYYGGNKDFYSDTLTSLAKYSFYTSETNAFIVYSLNIFLIILVVSCISSFFYNRSLISPKSMFIFITLISAFSVIMQHLLLDTLYLIDRTALFFYPLFILTLCFSLNDLKDRWYTKITTALITVAFVINFTNKANLIKTALWYFDAHSSETLGWLNEVGKRRHKVLNIYYSWPLQSSFGYYFEENKYPYLKVKEVTEANKYRPYSDFYIYLTQPLDKVDYNANEPKPFLSPRTLVREYPHEHIKIYSDVISH
ncbi:MAG: hypothetical protein V4677_18085 [Bacteroidota bacterium]